MQAKRRPVKSVYGKARVTQKSDRLWDEAISASPIVRRVIPYPAENVGAIDETVLSVTKELATQAEVQAVAKVDRSRIVLGATDANAVKSPRRRKAGKDVAEREIHNTEPRVEITEISDIPVEDILVKDKSARVPTITDPILASTPIRMTNSHSTRIQELTRSHIRFDTSDIQTVSELEDNSSSRSNSDDANSTSSDLSGVVDEDNSALEGLTTALSNLNTRQSTPSELADESTIAEENELCDIQTLLSLCDQTSAQDFTSYVKDLREKLTLRKLGEASFSEVFLGKNQNTGEETVYKVIPFGEHEDEVPINDIVQEVRISRAMSSLRGYVTLKSMVVVQGLYPAALLQLWDDWQAEFESESDRPDKYKSDQRYCVIALEHGGVDLEHFKIPSWQEAQRIFEQITEILSLGEKEKQFEHRDLHWGNVLVKGFHETDDCRVTIIDYTLSRAMVRDQLSDIAFYGFSDRAIFEAEGEDYQFDIYRLMRDSITDGQDDPSYEDWALFHPTTNVLWLHYLVDKILHEKNLKKPALRQTKRNPTLDEGEIAAWKMLDRTWTLLNPRRRYNQDECAIDSTDKVMSLIKQFD